MVSISTQRANSINSSSANTIRCKYDVFLSFRGEDTRDNFLEYVYRALRQKGILTFKDDDKLKAGEDIKGGLSQAIEESKFSIVVFSVNYASSSWCLDELLHILQCKRTIGHNVYPVFFHVEPTEVRKLKGEFGKGFAKASLGNEGKVEKWTEALEEVANSKGWVYPNAKFETEAKLIDDLVHKIFTKSVDTYPFPAKDLVGIRPRMLEVIRLLDLGSDETRVVGLWGMGGIGKSTLAKVVYHSISWQFEGCSFIGNVREEIKRIGLLALQGHLISDILKEKKFEVRNVMSGTSIFQNNVCRKKVLIVLDDVSEQEQLKNLVGELHSFSPGSRIIITTRDKRVLNGVKDIYSVQELKNKEAHELFKSIAFGKGVETEEFKAVIGRAVHHAKGCPLALKVLGSSLSGGTVPEWESALARLRESNDAEFQQILKVSYDGLHWTEQEIFLDISCFFKGMHKDPVIKILDGCGFSAVFGLNVLVKKALLTISEDGELWMHDLVQKMGWSIVDEESRKEPGERSRLWRPNDVKDVLMDGTGTNKVQGILVNPKNMQLRPKAFSKMTNLRVLMIHGAWCSINLSNKLRLLLWDGYPLKCMPPTFKPDHLVELRLTNSRIEKLWDRTMVLPNLTLIDLGHSKFLTKGPDLTGFRNLEDLVLEGCTALVCLHPSIRNLKKLMLLNLKGCSSLRYLPYRIESQCLQTLIFSGSSKLTKVLERFGDLTQLSRLNLDGTNITELPESIGKSTNLYYLDLSGCMSLKSIPSSIGELKQLRQLSLMRCHNLSDLPEEVGDIDSLEILDVSFSAIRQLPASVTRFGNLQKFICQACQITTPPSFSGFKSLTTLDLTCCCLKSIPETIAECLSLEALILPENDFEYLPTSIKSLSKLVRLWLSYCHSLQELPELPSNVREVFAYECISLKTICSSILHRDANKLWFADCPKLVGNKEISILMGYKFLLNQIKENKRGSSRLYTCPSSKIPEWISQRNAGGTLSLRLPIQDLHSFNLLGIAFSAVVRSNDRKCRIGVHMRTGGEIFNFGDVFPFSSGSENVIILFYPIVFFTTDEFRKGGRILEVCFVTRECPSERGSQTTNHTLKPAPEVKECGARLIFKDEVGSIGETDQSFGLAREISSKTFPIEQLKHPGTLTGKEAHKPRGWQRVLLALARYRKSQLIITNQAKSSLI